MFYSDRQLPACFGNSSLSWILWPSTARAPNDVERSGARVRGCGQRAVRDVGPGGVESIACPTGFALLGCWRSGHLWLGLAWLALHRIAPVLSRLSACWPASGLVALEWDGREELVLLPLFFCPASCCTLAPFRGETRD